MDGDWLRQDEGGDDGFVDGDSPDDEAVPMDIAVAADTEDELLNGPQASVYYTVPTDSSADAEDKGQGITKEEVEEMMKSEAYQKKIDTCHLCNACWYNGKFGQDCSECEGFHMTRPCLVCDGRCNQVWKRDIKRSHSLHKAHWDGVCKLPPDVQRAYLKEKKKSNAKSLTKGMQDLSTS